MCPSHLTCLAGGGCATDSELAACTGKSDGDSCEASGVIGARCRSGACVSACGNAVVDPGEVCDDGNADDGDGCGTTCTSDESCGNGITDPGEGCDDGNVTDHDGCQSVCTVQRCGDGIQDPDEACDDGNLLLGDGCTPNCQSDETCGNGVVDANVGEDCDDGDRESHDGCSSRCVVEQASWRSLGPAMPTARAGAAAAFDAARGCMVMFGGGNGAQYFDETWERCGTQWVEITTDVTPPARRDAVMGYDPDRHRIVMFGGRSSTGARNDTWEWNGKLWTRVAVPSPAARDFAAMAFDPVRRELLLFGGRNAFDISLDDTWAWNGARWLRLMPTLAPSPRVGPNMVTDPVAGDIVLLGGMPDLFDRGHDDTWRWNGITWTQISAGTVQKRSFSGLAFDTARGVIVMFGGRSDSCDCEDGDVDDTFELVGGTWTLRTPSTRPSPRSSFAMAYDQRRKRVVVYGGTYGTTARGGTWEWTGSDWENVEPDVTEPADSEITAAFDRERGRIVTFGSDEITYESDGSVWTTPTVATVPSWLYSAGLVEDPQSGVMFLGSNSNGDITTWRWNGASWTDLGVAPSPDDQEQPGLAADTHRGVVVMYGVTGTTWEWNGTAWTDRGTGPPTNVGMGLAYDPLRDRCVLFGALMDATWEWNGQTWTDRTQPFQPPPRRSAGITFDAASRNTIVFGGVQLDAMSNEFDSNDTWLWNGTTWRDGSEVGITISPDPQQRRALVYDPIRQRTVLPGVPTWALRFDSETPDEVCDARLDVDGDGLVGCADPDCRARCVPTCSFDEEAAGWCSASTGPRCGDGTCSTLENCGLCPSDCGACTAECGDGICDESAGCPGDCP